MATLAGVITLGIETSCDETACGLVDDRLRVLANAIYSQIDIHAAYGGVVPEIAARAHLEKIDPIVRAALDESGLTLEAVDQIAFTRGPGLLGPLLVGASFARALDQRDNFEFSFSGLKSAVLRYVETQPPETVRNQLPHICASLEAAIVDILVKKSVHALEWADCDVLTVVGGVSANGYLRERMAESARKRGFRAIFPAARFCGDNGVMIAALAQWRANHGIPAAGTAVTPSLRWS
jgi:tRNA A37 threonylcarbamoyltransferase TsaD